jgi:hypothetical protein
MRDQSRAKAARPQDPWGAQKTQNRGNEAKKSLKTKERLYDGLQSVMDILLKFGLQSKESWVYAGVFFRTLRLKFLPSASRRG